MKIIIDIPDSIIPEEFRKMYLEQQVAPELNKEALKKLLNFALSVQDQWKVGVDEYRLEFIQHKVISSEDLVLK